MGVAVVVALLASTGCRGDEPRDGAGSSAGADPSGAPTIVVTTSVWGDIVSAAIGAVAAVEVIIPVGADPHDFAPSARQAEQMAGADLVVVNGLGLEDGMTAVLERVRETGTPVVELSAAVDAIESESGHADPHIWLDPTRVVAALRALGDELAAVSSIDRAVIDDTIDASVAELEALDAEIESVLASIPAERRLLVTNHDSFAYFADRYGFEVVGTVIPSVSTNASPSASGLVELAELIRVSDVAAIFTESTDSDRLAAALATEVGGDIAVVELYGGSLGEPGSGADTYGGMMRTNAERIAAALANA